MVAAKPLACWSQGEVPWLLISRRTLTLFYPGVTGPMAPSRPFGILPGCSGSLTLPRCIAPVLRQQELLRCTGFNEHRVQAITKHRPCSHTHPIHTMHSDDVDTQIHTDKVQAVTRHIPSSPAHTPNTHYTQWWCGHTDSHPYTLIGKI